MLHEDPGNVSYSAVGGLSDQIRELRESIELPLMNPELFLRVGIKPPKVTIILAHFPPTFISVTLSIPIFLWKSFLRRQVIYILNSHLLGCSSLWASWYWEDFVS